MDIETRRRIRAYKKALPELRERVIAVALLLAMSASMLTSASFAWLTISRRPEVSGVSTTVAANGNLEIALATSEDHPDESEIGDSSAAKGQSVTEANITWGNLINLSDPSYGLNNLVLRPAQLNKESLLTSPLFGAVFTQDGRVERLTSNFSYTSWIPPEGTTPGYFGIANKLGVRAISSTKVEAQGFFGTVMSMKDTATSSNAAAVGKYLSITQESEWMAALASMMGVHMTASLNSEDKYKNAEVSPTQLQALIDMYGAFIDAFDLEAIAMADVLNLQLFLAWGGDTEQYNDYDAAAIMALNPNSGNDYVINANGKSVRITNLKTFKDDYKMLVENKAKMIQIRDLGDRRWTASGLSAIVNKLVNIDNCKVKFGNEDAQTVKAFMNSMSGSNIISAGMKYNNAECTAYITNGVLYNFDQRVGAGIRVTQNNSGTSKKGLPITAKVYSTKLNYEASAKIYATIETETTSPCNFAKDLAYADSLNTGAGENVGEMSAKDTYGLAIDLWVRTNADNSYLTLEGNVLTKEEEIDAMGKDANGNDVQLYSLARTGTDPETGEMMISDYTLYKIEIEVPNEETETMDKVDVWYNANDYSQFSLQEGESPTKKKETLITVVGYEGENRIWNSDEDKILLSTDATTQGSGSCYVYYADTPEDQTRSLELLKAMHVAFINVDGKLLATATMNADYSYEESGRVIVPLVLDGNSLQVGDEENPVLAITKLDKNVPTRITAIVYLDGTALTNDNVLSAAEIQGQLNIQFGSNLAMEPIRNETLEQAERKVSATVSRTEFNYDTDPDLTTKVSVTVTGEQPKNLTAFFIRKINDTQGSREPEMKEFRQNADGVWECDYTFTSPGVYILRTVELDGQEYPLPYSNENPLPTVTVRGFTVQSLSCSQAVGNVINKSTEESSYTVDLQLRFATDDPTKMPSTVQGRFLKDDGTAVGIDFTYNPSGSWAGYWTGSGTFLTSGDYTLQYLRLNGKYEEIPQHLWQTAHLELGMGVEVYTNGVTDFKYLESEMTDNMKVLPMRVRILDNGGYEKPGLQGAWLTYRLSTSTARKMRTELTWDPVQHFYTGNLLTLESGGPGTWVFMDVTLANGDVLTRASIAPKFIMRAPEPPSLYEAQPIPNTKDYFYSPDGGTYMEVNLKYSATATPQAIITDAAGTEYPVQGQLVATDDDGVSTWRFVIPDNAAGTYRGTQNGWWTMKSINVWNFIDANGNEIKAEIYGEGPNEGLLIPDGERDDPLVINMLGKNSGKDYKVKVVETFTLSFAGNSDRTFDGAFLQEHTVSGIYFDLYDFEGKKLDGVKNVSLVYSYDGDSKNHGGYESDKVVAKDSAFTINSFATDSEGVRFTQQQAQNLRLAGVYSPHSFTYTVGGKTYSYTTANMPAFVPKITVDSEAPEVWISAITPEKDKVITVDAINTEYVSDSGNATQGDEPIDTTGGCNPKDIYRYTWTFTTHSSHTLNTYAPTITNNNRTATVYFPCTHPYASGWVYDGGTSEGTADNPESEKKADKKEYHQYEYNGGNGVPSVTLSLSGLGNATKASLKFAPTSGSSVMMFASYKQDSGKQTYWADTNQATNIYEWTSDNSICKRFIGGMDNVDDRLGDDKRYVAGTLTANTLEVTCDLDGDGATETVNFTIPTITINNPY